MRCGAERGGVALLRRAQVLAAAACVAVASYFASGLRLFAYAAGRAAREREDLAGQAN